MWGLSLWIVGAFILVFAGVQGWRANRHYRSVMDTYTLVGTQAIFRSGVKQAYFQGQKSRDREMDFYRRKCEGYLEEIQELREQKGVREVDRGDERVSTMRNGPT